MNVSTAVSRLAGNPVAPEAVSLPPPNIVLSAESCVLVRGASLVSEQSSEIPKTKVRPLDRDGTDRR